MKEKRIELAEQIEVQAREVEIQLLMNIIEPNPEYQASLVTDLACLLDCSGNDERLVADRLAFYFGESMEWALRLPIWKLVDEIKRRWPSWPEEWPPDPS